MTRRNMEEELSCFLYCIVMICDGFWIVIIPWSMFAVKMKIGSIEADNNKQAKVIVPDSGK